MEADQSLSSRNQSALEAPCEPSRGITIPDNVKKSLAGVSAAVVALAVRHGASGPSLAVTRTLLSFGALVFSCDVVVALVQKGSAREAGQLCCYAVETESADVVRQIAVEMLVEGRVKEAAAVAVAFAEAARAKWGNIDRVLDLLSEAISQAVRRDHAANVAEVTDKLVKDGHPELVTSIMQRMMDKGMDEEAGKVSLAAAQRGKVGAMTGIMRDLASSQGGVSTLASVGLSAAKAGAQHVKDAIHSASAQLRQRAAHFAHFSTEDDGPRQEGDNVHVGGESARELGPWSSAYDLADGQRAAIQRREEQILARRRASDAEKAEAESAWKPHALPGKTASQLASVRPLAELALDTVVTLMEDVESLEGLPEAVTTKIGQRCCAKRAMSPHVVGLLIENAEADLVIDDCTLLEPADLEAALCSVAGPRHGRELGDAVLAAELQEVRLGLCGRGLTEPTVRSFAAKGPFPALRTLHLGGAYRLRDAELLRLLHACPNLTDLALPSACRLTGEALQSWAKGRERGTLEELDLSDDRGMDTDLLLQVIPQLGPLRSLKLAGCDLALDSAFEGPAPVFGDLPLQELDLERCPHVTDSVVSALGALYPGLRHLTLDECAAVTDASLLALAGSCRQLETLSLRRCWRVSETGLEALARLGSLRALCLANVPAAGPALLRTLAAYCGSQLERLDVSWCRALPDHALGQLVDSCPRLTRLDLWGCTQVTPRFLEGHGKLDLSVHGAPRSLVQAA